MISPTTLDEAVIEAERFIKAAKLAKTRLLTDKYAVCGCKETGAVRRASLDLTRSLAQLRNPNYRGKDGS